MKWKKAKKIRKHCRGRTHCSETPFDITNCKYENKCKLKWMKNGSPPEEWEKRMFK
jgi:hypothetical protein